MKSDLVVVTGGPGTGKSTLLQELIGIGYSGIEEGGRAIIRDQRRVAGPGLPWLNPELFSELLLSWHLRSYRMAEQEEGLVFLDRGLPDAVAFLTVRGIPIPEHISRAALEFRYNSHVFIAPPWKEIYRSDEERPDQYEQTIRSYEHLVQAYVRFGYRLVSLPLAPVAERAQFVINFLSTL